MSFSNFNDSLSANNYCDPNDIGIEYEAFSGINGVGGGVDFQLPLDSSFNDFNIQKPIGELNTFNETNFATTETKKKMTHKDCVNIYKNPNICSEEQISNSLKHILKCNICRKEIKGEKDEESIKSNRKKDKKKELDDIDDIDGLSNRSNRSNRSSDYKTKMINRINELSEEPKSILKNNDDKFEKYKYDAELKDEINKNMKENFLKYQNAILKEKIKIQQEEKKDFEEKNKKIDKLMKMVNYNISQNTKISNILNNNLKNINKKDDTKDNNEINVLTSYNVLIYCSIIIIILLVTDIIFRIMYSSSH
jgi:hypothetical protein